MTTSEIQQIQSTIKKMLKNCDLQYREFAVEMEMSESGLKKLLNGSDLSMSRLVQIANILRVPLSELIQAAEQPKPLVIRLNEAQQDYFLENVECYYFFSTLVEHLFDRDQVQAISGLSDDSADTYLRQLATLGLIDLEFNPRTTVCSEFIRERLKCQGVAVYVGARLNRRVRREMSLKLLDAADDFACNGSELYDSQTLAKISEAFLQRRFTLTVDSVNALRLSLRELITTYSKRSAIESTIHPKEQLVNIGWSYAIAPFNGSYPLSEL